MPSFILTPLAAGSQTNLSPIPIGRANYLCVDDYPNDLDTSSYVFAENGTLEDLYDSSVLISTLKLDISSLRVVSNCKRENTSQVCTVEPALRPSATTYRGDAQTLTESFVEYSNEWLVNPEDAAFWTLTAVNALEFGHRLVSGGAGTEAQSTQSYAEITASIIGEKVSNSSSYQPSDVIHLNQGYSIIAKEEQGRNLFGASTIQINYKGPDGVSGSLPGSIIDSNAIIAPMPAATNNQTKKWWFKLYAILAGGEILEGVPFFANVQPEWV